MRCRPYRCRRVALSAAAVLALSCAAFAADEKTPMQQRGEALVARNCASCHAAGPAGASPHAEAPPLRTIGRSYPVESLEEALGEGLVAAHSDMPEFKFSAADVGALIAYLQSIQER
jgi:cytochrome c